MYFITGQLEKLSDLFLDIAKGLFLASIAAPAIAKEGGYIMSFVDIFNSWITFMLLVALIFAILLSIDTRKKSKKTK